MHPFLLKVPISGCNHAFISEKFEWVVSNEVLLEYEEIISKRYSASISSNVITILTIAPNTLFFDSFYQWKLIANDADDNKFADLYLSSNADVLVTQDLDFNILNTLEFPSIKVISLADFKLLLRL